MTAKRFYLLGAMAGTLGLALLAPAPARSDDVVTTLLRIPVQGTVFANNESIPLAGSLYMAVSARLINGPPIRIRTLLAASGVGQTSGKVYYAYGLASFTSDLALPNTYAFSATYSLQQGLIRQGAPGPPIFPLPLSHVVGVNANGSVAGASVNLEGPSVDF